MHPTKSQATKASHILHKAQAVPACCASYPTVCTAWYSTARTACTQILSIRLRACQEQFLYLPVLQLQPQGAAQQSKEHTQDTTTQAQAATAALLGLATCKPKQNHTRTSCHRRLARVSCLQMRTMRRIYAMLTPSCGRGVQHP